MTDYEWAIKMLASAVLVGLVSTHGPWWTAGAVVLCHLVRIGSWVFTPDGEDEVL